MKIIKELIPYVVIIIVVVLIRTYIVTPVRVDGPSMNPTLQNGQILLLNKTNKKYKRMDVVVFQYGDERLIKRVIGLPGESVLISDNTLFINGKEIEDYRPDVETANFKYDEVIPEGYYFVLGDNRYNSSDSRVFGLVSEEDIKGTASIRIFPFTKIGKI